MMKYYMTTYTEYSHRYLVATLGSMNIEYKSQVYRNDEIYSKFEVISNVDTYNLLKNIIEQGNGTSITIEYGA